MEMILTYVPEAEYMSYECALTLAKIRDELAAQELLDSIKENSNG